MVYVTEMERSNIEQRHPTKYYLELNGSSKESFDKLITNFVINKIIKEFGNEAKKSTSKYSKRLRKRVIKVRADITKTWLFHHVNAPYHCAFSVMQFSTSKNIPVWPQSPYSSDACQCDFFLFP